MNQLTNTIQFFLNLKIRLWFLPCRVCGLQFLWLWILSHKNSTLKDWKVKRFGIPQTEKYYPISLFGEIKSNMNNERIHVFLLTGEISNNFQQTCDRVPKGIKLFECLSPGSSHQPVKKWGSRGGCDNGLPKDSSVMVKTTTSWHIMTLSWLYQSSVEFPMGSSFACLWATKIIHYSFSHQ